MVRKFCSACRLAGPWARARQGHGPVGVVESGGCAFLEKCVSQALVIQQPPGPAQQLFLLFHGVGGQPQDMQALGLRLAQAFAQAVVIALPGPQESDLGRGRQWFSVRGIDEASRCERVAQALPDFVAEVRRWQAQLQVPPAATALLGFSQGGILALEAGAQDVLLAARVIAIGARYARLPQQVHAQCTLHLVHGKADTVMPYGLAVAAAEHLLSIDADVTADVLPFVGHEISADVMDAVLARLQGYIPQARWREALAAAAAQQAGEGG